MKSKFVAYSTTLKRELFLRSARSFEEAIAGFEVKGDCFAVFLGCDASNVSSESIKTFAKLLLNKGAVYFCCYGPDCERVHDLIDSEIVTGAFEGDYEREDKPAIMTTWHSKESLADALFFFVENSMPDGEYFDRCAVGIIIPIGASNLEARILGVLNEMKL